MSDCFTGFFASPSLVAVKHMSLDHKIMHSKRVIKEFCDFMEGKVSVSFSGGKDSAVLLHLVRSVYPDTPAVFFDTGMEYPEIVEFVKTKDDVTIIKPTYRGKPISFRKVIDIYGYPVIGKETAHYIEAAQKGQPSGLRRLEDDGRFGVKKWAWLMDAPFRIGDGCCHAMKKRPAEIYHNDTGNAPFIGVRNEESQMRKAKWMNEGENRLSRKIPQSAPLSIWSSEDVDAYIERHNIELSRVYTEMGYKRTGCMFCMFGIMSDGTPNRFQMMKHTHPKQWEYCMRPAERGGLGLQRVLDFIRVPSGAEQSSLEDFTEAV